MEVLRSEFICELDVCVCVGGLFRVLKEALPTPGCSGISTTATLPALGGLREASHVVLNGVGSFLIIWRFYFDWNG